ncbi:MAG: hypothetical protein IJ501_04980 [Bacilli bacterium]|nr:hypothetical protein [Bacilli bacterium]
MILYLNYLTIGYSIFEYLNLIFKRFECLLAILGIIILVIAIFKGD